MHGVLPLMTTVTPGAGTDMSVPRTTYGTATSGRRTDGPTTRGTRGVLLPRLTATTMMICLPRLPPLESPERAAYRAAAQVTRVAMDGATMPGKMGPLQAATAVRVVSLAPVALEVARVENLVAVDQEAENQRMPADGVTMHGDLPMSPRPLLPLAKVASPVVLEMKAASLAARAKAEKAEAIQAPVPSKFSFDDASIFLTLIFVYITSKITHLDFTTSTCAEMMTLIHPSMHLHPGLTADGVAPRIMNLPTPNGTLMDGTAQPPSPLIKSGLTMVMATPGMVPRQSLSRRRLPSPARPAAKLTRLAVAIAVSQARVAGQEAAAAAADPPRIVAVVHEGRSPRQIVV